MLDKSQIADELKRVLNNELDDCERALRANDIAKAKRELDDAITKIKRIQRDI